MWFPKQLKKGTTSVKPKISPATVTRENFTHQCISISNYLWRSVTELVSNLLNIHPLNAIEYTFLIKLSPHNKSDAQKKCGFLLSAEFPYQPDL